MLFGKFDYKEATKVGEVLNIDELCVKMRERFPIVFLEKIKSKYDLGLNYSYNSYDNGWNQNNDLIKDPQTTSNVRMKYERNLGPLNKRKKSKKRWMKLKKMKKGLKKMDGYLILGSLVIIVIGVGVYICYGKRIKRTQRNVRRRTSNRQEPGKNNASNVNIRSVPSASQQQITREVYDQNKGLSDSSVPAPHSEQVLVSKKEQQSSLEINQSRDSEISKNINSGVRKKESVEHSIEHSIVNVQSTKSSPDVIKSQYDFNIDRETGKENPVLKGSREEISKNIKSIWDRYRIGIEALLKKNSSHKSAAQGIENFTKEINELADGINDIRCSDEAISEKVTDKFLSVLSKRILDTIILEIARSKTMNDDFYKIMLKCLNEYMKAMGMYTKDIPVGDDADEYDEIMEISAKKTKNKEWHNKIYKVLRLPYYMDYETRGRVRPLIVSGKMTVYVCED